MFTHSVKCDDYTTEANTHLATLVKFKHERSRSHSAQGGQGEVKG